MSKLPIDRGWAFVVVVGFFTSSFIMVGTAKSYGIIMVELIKKFSIDKATGALVMGISGVVYTILAPFCVAFGEHFTQRKVVILGSLVGFVMIAVASLLVNIEFFIFFYGVGTGLANACFFGNGLVMVGMYFKRWRSLATGIALTGASVGTFVLPILLEALLETYSLSGAILVVSAIYLNGCICGALYRPLSFYIKKSTSDQEKLPIVTKEPEPNGLNETGTEKIQTEKVKVEDEQDEDEGVKKGLLEESQIEESKTEQVSQPQSPPAKPVWTFHICGRTVEFPVIFHFGVLALPVVVFFTVFSFLVFVGYFNFVLFLPIDAMERGITHYEKAALVSYTGAGDLLGRILVGVMGDLTVIKRYKILATCSILCGVNIILFEIAGSVYWWMSLHASLYGFFGGCFVAINSIVLIDMVGLEMMPKALGVVLLIQGLGAAIGQPIEGKIQDVTGSFTTLNIINSIFMIAAGLLLFLYPLVKRFQNRSSRQAENREVEIPEEAS
ncbi:monocarboxylate transporter 12-like [Saccostrea cucullata]|uniref:monocarboxylate transporter 12-like n=1 Tax=Saccostrea cuccullata TaxID=36930 RepID=UPI002ED2AD51